MKYLKNLSIFLQYNLFLHKIQKNCNKPTKMYDAKILHLSYKIQEMYDSVVSENSSMIVYCSNRNKTQRMCDEAVDDCLEALKFVPDWFATSKMLEKLIMLYSLMMICSFLIKIFINSHLLLIK